ncbi:hypothetical protein [Winogradskyella marincola]|uniref:Uncharacterized protein n=1 Tax=Winogradskyella marincola TaxID=3037795 RepID=A0ABT6FZP1_9FLAO|nr:hypothetical protein [Winogradskyella sp. YYF002]MDG4715064.1 hypothetical protein [Winogradskyella sp. YYF002]
MTDEELKKIIFELEKRNEKEKAFFGFYEYGGGPDESHIKANRKGLELFATELLKVGIESENREFKKNGTESIGLNTDWLDENGEFFFDFVELTKKDKAPTEKTFPEHKETWKDKAFRVGCFGIGILLVGLIIVGLITVLNWI